MLFRSKDNLYDFYKYLKDHNQHYFTLKKVQNVAKQALEALAYIHSLGMIHCDIKPENIVMKSFSRCEIKIIDFGLAEKITKNNMNNDDLFFWFPNLIKNCLLKYNLIRDIRDGYIPPNSHSKLNEIIDFVTKLNNKEIISHDEALIHPFFYVLPGNK